MAASLAQFEKQLTGALAPVYLVAGDEHLLAMEAADAVRNAARREGYSERDVLESGESGFEWNRLAQSGASLSLFASRRLIDLRVPTGRPGNEGAEAIKQYCAAPPADTILLITASTWSKSHETSWVEALGHVGRIFIAWPLKRHELPDFLARRAAAAKLDLAPDAFDVLIERTEGNLLAAAQEIDKLGLLAQGRRLDAAALETLVADSSRFDVFKLVDAALAGDASRALHIVDSLRAEGDAVPGLLGIVVKELQTMVRLGSAIDSGATIATALRNERVWQSKEGLYKNALVRGRSRFWEERLAHAVRVEKMGKGRLQGDAWREFGRLIAEMSNAGLAKATS